MHYEWSFESLARHAGRPPLASERLSLLPDGRLLYRLKHRWHDGTTHVIYEPLELMERLAALVPPPRFNLTRYSGVLASASAFRPLLVPQEEARAPAGHAGCEAVVAAAKNGSDGTKDEDGCRSRHYPWAQLMARVFEFDVLACPRCGAKMRILAAIDAPDAIRKILSCLGLPTRAPPVAPAIRDEDIAASW